MDAAAADSSVCMVCAGGVDPACEGLLCGHSSLCAACLEGRSATGGDGRARVICPQCAVVTIRGARRGFVGEDPRGTIEQIRDERGLLTKPNGETTVLEVERRTRSVSQPRPRRLSLSSLPTGVGPSPVPAIRVTPPPPPPAPSDSAQRVLRVLILWDWENLTASADIEVMIQRCLTAMQRFSCLPPEPLFRVHEEWRIGATPVDVRPHVFLKADQNVKATERLEAAGWLVHQSAYFKGGSDEALKATALREMQDHRRSPRLRFSACMLLSGDNDFAPDLDELQLGDIPVGIARHTGGAVMPFKAAFALEYWALAKDIMKLYMAPWQHH